MRCPSFNPLHPNISIHILHTLLCTIPLVLTGRICLTIKSFVRLATISVILMILMNDSAALLWGEITCWSLTEIKRLIGTRSLSFQRSSRPCPHQRRGALWASGYKVFCCVITYFNRLMKAVQFSRNIFWGKPTTSWFWNFKWTFVLLITLLEKHSGSN